MDAVQTRQWEKQTEQWCENQELWQENQAILRQMMDDMKRGERKVAHYERLDGRPVARRIIISPMIAPQARTMAEQLGIELYSDPENVPL